MLNNEYQSVYTLAAYVQDEVKLLDAISVVAGIRYAYNEKFKSQFTPKLSLMYQYSGLNVRASYAAGFRSPTLQQMYAVSESRGQITVGDPGLDPEKSNFYNLNIEYNHRLFSIAASIYQNDLKDKIEAEDIGTTPEDIENGITRRRQYRNIEKARVKGFDIGFQSVPSQASCSEQTIFTRTGATVQKTSVWKEQYVTRVISMPVGENME